MRTSKTVYSEEGGESSGGVVDQFERNISPMAKATMILLRLRHG
jgi:hypothetical protein